MDLRISPEKVGLRVVAEPHVSYRVLCSVLHKKGRVEFADGYSTRDNRGTLYLTADQEAAKRITGANWRYELGLWVPDKMLSVADDLVGLVMDVYMENRFNRNHRDCL